MRINKLYEGTKISDFKELINIYKTDYKDMLAFQYRNNPEETDFINITYGKFAEDIENLAVALLKHKCKRIAIISPNRYEWCVAYLAIVSSGLIAVPLDKSLPTNEIVNSLERSNVDSIIYAKEYDEAVGQCKNKFCMDDNSYADLLKEGKKLSHKDYDQVTLNTSEMSVILFTSGTTSLSKIVMISQKALLTNLYNYSQMFIVPKGSKFLSFLPLHHTFESTITFLYGTSIGITICFCDGLKYINKDLIDFQIDGFVCVPLMLEVMYKKMLKAIEKQGKTKLVNIMRKLFKHAPIGIKRKIFHSIIDGVGGHLKYIVSGGAPMDKPTIQGFNDFGFMTIQGYGLTETCSAVAVENFRDRRPGSVGLILPENKIKIANPDEDGIGELLIKTDAAMLGYYGNEEATKEAFDEEGYFRTGDTGYIDKDGFIFITGRIKDMIVLKNGKKIFPEELEFLINKLPYVAESMVFGHEDDTRNDRNEDVILCTKIVYDKEKIKQHFANQDESKYQELIENDIKETINKQMPAYKYIRKVLITDEPLIKTTTLKIKRNEEMKKIQL